jgi:hypothetical protein
MPTLDAWLVIGCWTLGSISLNGASSNLVEIGVASYPCLHLRLFYRYHFLVSEATFLSNARLVKDIVRCAQMSAFIGLTNLECSTKTKFIIPIAQVWHLTYIYTRLKR